MLDREQVAGSNPAAGTNDKLIDMLYARVILMVLLPLAAIYYAMVIGQLFGKWKITQRRITFAKLCVPFYYWVVSQTINKPKQ